MRRAIAVSATVASVLFAVTSTAAYATVNTPAVTATVCTSGVWTQEPANVLPAMVNGDLNAASVASPALAWAVGDYYTGTSFGSLIEKWNSTGWSVIGKGEPDAQLYAVASFGSSHAVAVGAIAENDETVVHALISQWNGSRWNPIALALPAKAKASSLYLVSGSSSSDIWAAGTYTIGREQHVLLEHSNGSSWIKVSLPARAQSLGEPTGIVDLAPNNVWADGVSDSGVLRMWHYNGTTWSLESAMPPVEGSLTGSSDDDLWITGFDSVWHFTGSWSEVGRTNADASLYVSAEGARGAASLWTAGWVFDTSTSEPLVYIEENGVKVHIPKINGFLQGLGVGFGLAFAVGYPNSGQPIVLASCD
jgi:hypothetical protein